MHIKHLFVIPKISISKIEVNQTTIHIFAAHVGNRARCPACKTYSYSVHDRYIRRITDLPVFQYHTIINLSVRKFKCMNEKCHRRVYVEQNEHISPHARRTSRVNRLLSEIAIELAAGAGSRLSENIKVRVSRSTLTRLAHSQPIPIMKSVKALGIDDWAFRKGVNYGTILVDMQTSKPIDLLPTRNGADLNKWLQDHPDIEIITRDRASSYSAAIDSACPNAIQVADRFHLLKNLSDAMDTYFKSITPQINALFKKGTWVIPESVITQVQINKSKKMSAPTEKADSRLHIFDKVKELQAQGLGSKRISRELGIGRNTVRSYFLQDILTPKVHPKRTNIESFTNYIMSRISKEEVSVGSLIEDIRKMGYWGGNTQAYQHISFLKGTIQTTKMNQSNVQQKGIIFIKMLSTRKLARYIGYDMKKIEDTKERKYFQLILKMLPKLRLVRNLVRKFKRILKTGAGDISRWILDVKESTQKLPGLLTFARGMERDIEAVKNGIKLKWSNGPVEGHVNRIKCIKRQMYGRASFELLRRKVLLSNFG